ncbi:MAG: TolC family protein [Mucilaginibacter sp.]
MVTIRFLVLTTCLFLTALFTYAQVGSKKSSTVFAPPIDAGTMNSRITIGAKDTNINHTNQFLTLRQCIDYALLHQPALNRSLLNVNITKETNAVNLAAWLPQANASGNLIHYIQVPGTTVATSGTATSSSSRVANTFVPELAVSQAIFSPSLLYTSKTAPLYVQQANLVTDSAKIYLVSSISKSFYNVLLNLEQINVLKEDTARLGKNVRDTYHQYIGGIVDETDYEEATITLNNSKAQLRQANENVVPEFAALKQLMGYPSDQQFNVSFDTTEMKQAIYLDTAQQLQYEKRIEFQQLNTQKQLQKELIHYYNFQWVPTVSAFFNYDLAFQNNNLGNLLGNSYPTSLIGLSFNIPIFTGFARLHNVQKAKLQSQVLDWDATELKSQIYTQYTSAMANYKGNLYNLQLLERNVALAKRTYFVVTLQYKQGIVAYLNVITAESNLISSEISYLNALFQVLSNKIDLQKAMGTISY